MVNNIGMDGYLYALTGSGHWPVLCERLNSNLDWWLLLEKRWGTLFFFIAQQPSRRPHPIIGWKPHRPCVFRVLNPAPVKPAIWPFLKTTTANVVQMAEP